MPLNNTISLEYRTILDWIPQDSAVLDLGCGDGELLSLLTRYKQVRPQGIEIDEQAVYRCVAKGISVFHEDIDNGLPEYGDRSFDYVILSQSFQQVKKPDEVLREALRVGRKVIISFPNFAHWSARYQMTVKGMAPITPSLPYEWHDTPNTHFLSISDFIRYCRKRSIPIQKALYIENDRAVKILPNLLASIGLFLISGEKNN